jgi:hypothetical protein
MVIEKLMKTHVEGFGTLSLCLSINKTIISWETPGLFKFGHL